MQGFFECRLDGEIIFPHVEFWYAPLPLFVCANCGRIIDGPTLRIVGERQTEWIKKPKKLPEFDGYTIDLELCEFRKAPVDGVAEIIKFWSPEAYKLFGRIHQALIDGTWQFAYTPLG